MGHTTTESVVGVVEVVVGMIPVPRRALLARGSVCAVEPSTREYSGLIRG